MPVCKTCGDHFTFRAIINGVDKYLGRRRNCLKCKPWQPMTDRICLGQNKFKQACIEYKGGACQICKYNRIQTALAFHHIEKSKKKFNISGAKHKGWMAVIEELDKCVLLCHNCHNEVHGGLVPCPTEIIKNENVVNWPELYEMKNGLRKTPPIDEDILTQNKTAEQISKEINIPSHRIRKQRKEKNIKIDYGKIIEKPKPPRDELEKIVREIPLKDIGKKYNVSVGTVKKWCNYYNIKTPSKSYWVNQIWQRRFKNNDGEIWRILVDKEKLQSLVWQMPLRQIVKKYGVTLVLIIKQCSKLGVDRPHKTYWNKPPRKNKK